MPKLLLRRLLLLCYGFCRITGRSIMDCFFRPLLEFLHPVIFLVSYSPVSLIGGFLSCLCTLILDKYWEQGTYFPSSSSTFIRILVQLFLGFRLFPCNPSCLPYSSACLHVILITCVVYLSF